MRRFTKLQIYLNGSAIDLATCFVSCYSNSSLSQTCFASWVRFSFYWGRVNTLAQEFLEMTGEKIEANFLT